MTVVLHRAAGLTALGGTLAALLVVLASPVSAGGRLDGVWAGSIRDCMASNRHVGTYANNRMASGFNGLDYGWLEWRASRNGACNHYQWVRLHVENTIPVVAWTPQWLHVEYARAGVHVRSDIRPQVVGMPDDGGGFLSYVEPGVYDAGLIYSWSPDASIASWSTSSVKHPAGWWEPLCFWSGCVLLP